MQHKPGALVALAAGLVLIARHADALGEPINFDVIKRHFRRRERPSWVAECLTHLAMLAFFAAACAIIIVTGYGAWSRSWSYRAENSTFEILKKMQPSIHRTILWRPVDEGSSFVSIIVKVL